MKKRMFITTIVMMLVLAVALTTSSLAWFSSANTSVTAQSATFTATSSGDSNVNLKISNSTESWGNTISLTSAADRTMVGMIPQTALVASTTLGENAYTAPTFTGVTINGTHEDVVHGDYAWPARIAFNSATIDDESYFIIDKDAVGKKANGDDATEADRNGVTNYTTSTAGGVNGYTGFYYDEFYIHNADTQSVINSLNFQVRGSLTNIATGQDVEESDYTCNGYAAFIIFDAVAVTVGQTVPANALENAGATVIAYGGSPEEGQVAATTSGENGRYLAWVPFAAFTFAMEKGSNETVQEAAWQFADLDAVDNDAFVYARQNDGSGVLITALKTQEYDALSGDTGFTLNTNTLRALNDKVPNYQNNIVNTGNAERDTTSVFNMKAGETFRVAFYFWLDGYTMTSFTDTTVAEVGIRINAAQ